MSKGTLKEIKISGGWEPDQEDNRDFQLGALYKLPALEEIPNEFTVSQVLKIKDQGQSDLCTAFSSIYASEIQEKIELSPEWQFAKIKELSGNINRWGSDIRTALKSLVKFGSLPASEVPEELKYSDEKDNRNIIANIKNWPALENKAIKFKKSSFFKITGPYDDFDNIRASLWQSKKDFEKEKNPSLLKFTITGAIWKHAWTVAENGIIPTQEFSGGFGHAFIFIGTKVFNGEIYLETQLSNGKEVGDEGSFYFNRKVINRELKWGAYTLRDEVKEDVRFLLKNNLTIRWLFIAKIINFLRSISNLKIQ